LEHIACDCPVLGTWAERPHRRRPRVIGKSQVHHNLYPTSTKLLEGEPLRVVSHKMDLRGCTLRWLLERIDKRYTYYLSGEMMVGSKLERVQDLDLYRPADFDGKVLRLHYARAEELGPYLGLVAAQEVSLNNEGPEEAIPHVLRQHL
jgi:inner membrane protein